MTDHRLLPCPFCGHPPTTEKINTLWWIACDRKECPAFNVTVNKPEYEDAVAHWNNRVPAPVVAGAGVVERLRKYFYEPTPGPGVPYMFERALSQIQPLPEPSEWAKLLVTNKDKIEQALGLYPYEMRRDIAAALLKHEGEGK